MLFTSRINEAIKLASHLHRNQIRKDNNKTPYISHLVSVAMILREVTDDEDIIIAGLMHDSLEDVPNYTYDNLVSNFGNRVADIVSHVTEPLDANKGEEEQLPWLTRKEKYLENLRSGGTESAMVSTSDKIHNTESFISDVLSEQDEFISRFHSSLRNRLWFHEQVLLIVEEKLGRENKLVSRLTLCTEEFRELVNKYE
ncbi:HD domain-containing protein [Candidatus Gracilibacteria bacterium]|nr:HD domain-containing protein [Candidatus Gracilibacteria bacterium]MCF7898982.1 HD domain-containing protein [Candidatus Paceibacterota bacterium]